jgi:site-specific recombinase XerD
MKGGLNRNKKPIADLPSGVGVSKVFFKEEPYWRVRLGKRFTGGSVHLKHFKELSDAREFIFGTKGEDALSDLAQIHTGAVKIRSRFGSGGFILTPGQLAEAQDAFRRLPEKVSLTEILNDWFKRRSPAGGVKLMKTVAAEFLVSRSAIGVRSRTLVMYESQLRKINEEFGEIPIGDIERSSIEDWIAESEWSPRTRKNFLVCLTTLFNFAINREYCSTNTAGKIARPILDDSVPGILTVPQAKALLEMASVGIPKDKKKEGFKPRPKMVSAIAIGLFSGLRRSELCLLDWSEIDLENGHIEVKGVKSKTRQRRLVAISENLKAWLQPFVQVKGTVTPTASEDAFGDQLREISSASGIKEWPHNAMRHSFGSYFFAKSKNENLTASEMGNSPAMVFQHYRALVKEGDAVEYWLLRPGT